MIAQFGIFVFGMTAIFLVKFGRVPWVHGMRMLGQCGERWPLASADSTNVAQNWKRNTGCAKCMATVIDAIQPAPMWKKAGLQQDLFIGETK